MKRGLVPDERYSSTPYAELGPDDPDRLCFDHSQMTLEEREEVQGLQKMLELDTWNDAFAMGVAASV